MSKWWGPEGYRIASLGFEPRAFTFVWEPPIDDVETLAELGFRDLGESTEVHFRQGPFKTEARRALHRDGWGDSFDKLERLLSGRA